MIVLQKELKWPGLKFDFIGFKASLIPKSQKPREIICTQHKGDRAFMKSHHTHKNW